MRDILENFVKPFNKRGDRNKSFRNHNTWVSKEEKADGFIRTNSLCFETNTYAQCVFTHFK